VSIDERLVRCLHVESLRHRDLHPEHEHHALFQASTIAALLEGNFEGDVTIEELGGHGDLGLGTLNGLDGEMIVIDGQFFHADVDGFVAVIDPTERTPFAAVTWFEPSLDLDLEEPVEYENLLAGVDALAGDPDSGCAIRVDGTFESVTARSVPRQFPPYRPLLEAMADEHVFEFTDVEGTIVGFRLPDYARGIGPEGYHLHFISADREQGGHVLSARTDRVTVELDLSGELHVELPPGVDLDASELDEATASALNRAERDS
jgi:acetolactate decarboxylase